MLVADRPRYRFACSSAARSGHSSVPPQSSSFSPRLSSTCVVTGRTYGAAAALAGTRPAPAGNMADAVMSTRRRIVAAQWSPEGDDRLHLDGDVERELRDAYRRSGVFAVVSPELEDQVAETVDDGRHAVEVRRGVDQPERLHPRAHAVEVAELSLQ